MNGFTPDLLKGKRAVVTGGATGIGKVIALELARHGADVAVLSRTQEKLELVAKEIEALGRKSLVLPCDVADDKQVKESFKKLDAQWNGLDILINNAAANFIRPSEKLTPVRWRKVIDIVLNGTFYGSLEAGKRMLAQGSGRIVNIIAAYAWTGAPGLSPSASAKAGVQTLTKSLGAEWASRGITVNAIAPGLIDTPQTRERLWPTEDMVTRMLKSVPQGKFGEESDIAGLVLYLCSDLGKFITGETITADGGQWLGKGALEMLGELRSVRKTPAKA